MSLAMMAAAWGSDAPPTDRLVLLALADWANTEGAAWPSIASIVEKTGLSERGVRTALRRLEQARHISTEHPPGRSARYSVHPIVREGGGHMLPPAGDAPGTTCPRQEMPETPAPAAPKPLRTVIPQKTSSSSVARARATRLDPDWQADDDWLAWACSERGWSRDEAERVAEDFRDYWVAKAGKDGMKLDWPATWRRWVRNTRETSPALRSRGARIVEASNEVFGDGRRRNNGRTMNALRRFVGDDDQPF